MTDKHTPGPWSVQDPMGDGVEDDLWIVAGDQVHNWRCLALVSCDTEKGPAEKPVYRPQRDANAQLMATAPELLALAEGMIPRNVCLTNSSISDDLIVPLDVSMGELRKIAAVVAKAKRK